MFDDDALRSVAKEASELGTGARGLRAIVDKILRQARFDVPGSDIRIVHVFKDAAKIRVDYEYYTSEYSERDTWYTCDGEPQDMREEEKRSLTDGFKKVVQDVAELLPEVMRLVACHFQKECNCEVPHLRC